MLNLFQSVHLGIAIWVKEQIFMTKDTDRIEVTRRKDKKQSTTEFWFHVIELPCVKIYKGGQKYTNGRTISSLFIRLSIVSFFSILAWFLSKIVQIPPPELPPCPQAKILERCRPLDE